VLEATAFLNPDQGVLFVVMNRSEAEVPFSAKNSRLPVGGTAAAHWLSQTTSRRNRRHLLKAWT
jgi:Glycosyl hydrolase family 30 beta sandwich domain